VALPTDQLYCCRRVPLLVKSFFGSYPESCRFLIRASWSLLLTPGMAAGGAVIAAFAFIARVDAFGFIAVADAFGFIARLRCVESTDSNHYKSADRKRRGCDEDRCFKRGHYPMATHGYTSIM
jgi:hypothetical protein